MERLINILKQNEKITDWIVVNTVSKSNEIFLIKDKVDMNRSCVTNETSVRVFVDFEENGDKFKGDSTVVLNLSDSDDEIKEKLTELLLQRNLSRTNTTNFQKKKKVMPHLKISKCAKI